MAEPEKIYITAEEYAGWLTPAEAIATLTPWPDGVAVDAILKRARHELIAAAARHVVRHGARGAPAEFARVPPSWWDHAENVDMPHAPFWRTGDAAFAIPGDPREYHSRESRYEFFGIKFDPLGVRALAPEPPKSAVQIISTAATIRPTAQSAGKQALAPKVSPKALRAWVAQYGAANPGSTFKEFLQNAKLAFPKFRVAERPVKNAIAELNLTLRPGNPTILRKNSRIENAE